MFKIRCHQCARVYEMTVGLDCQANTAASGNFTGLKFDVECLALGQMQTEYRTDIVG